LASDIKAFCVIRSTTSADTTRINTTATDNDTSVDIITRGGTPTVASAYSRRANINAAASCYSFI